MKGWQKMIAKDGKRVDINDNANGAIKPAAENDQNREGLQSIEIGASQVVRKSEKGKPCFTNTCTFTKPVHIAYLRGIEPKAKTAILVFFMALSVMLIALGVGVGVRLDIIGAGLLGCVVCGLAFGQPWMMARSKTMNIEHQYGAPQRNITRFYENHMVMQNLTADVDATALYTDIKRLRETDDFIYLYVGKYCYFAIKTGFTRGEEEIAPFKKFIQERAVNAKGCLKRPM